MGIIKGRKNCNYNQDWFVSIFFLNGKKGKIAEQLRFEEAKEIYEEVKRKMQDSSDFIEIKTEKSRSTDNWDFINKKNIVAIEIDRD